MRKESSPAYSREYCKQNKTLQRNVGYKDDEMRKYFTIIIVSQTSILHYIKY